MYSLVKFTLTLLSIGSLVKGVIIHLPFKGEYPSGHSSTHIEFLYINLLSLLQSL